MRPPWEKICEIVYNIDKQTMIIQRLMLEGEWGVELPDFKSRPERPPTPPKHITLAEPPQSLTQQSLAGIKNLVQFAPKLLMNANPLVRLRKEAKKTLTIDSQEWYWGDIVNRDNTNLILKSCPDGSFIVRNSTDKSASAPFTLCVMKGTFVKSIKIFKQELNAAAAATDEEPHIFFDIEKPCRFESLQSLIDYYSRVSLKEYNHNLDLRLTYGVSKFKFGRASEWSIDKLYTSFKEALDKFELLTKSCDILETDLATIREDLAQKRIAYEAVDKIIAIFEAQLDKVNSILTNSLLKKSNALSASTMLATQFMPVQGRVDNEADRLTKENKLRLQQKLGQLKVKKEDILKSIDYLNLNLSELQEKLDSLRPELIELKKKRENYHMWLLQRGENEDKIQTIVEPARTQFMSGHHEQVADSTGNMNQESYMHNRIMKPSVSMGDLNKMETSAPSLSLTNLDQVNKRFI